jgi:protein associated with RNAse G/E
VLQRAHEPPKHEHDGFVMLVPSVGQWMGIWNVEDEPEIYVDVTTTPHWSAGSVTAIDLDLDVVRRRDGTVELLDQDEFEEHRVAFGYPPEVAEAAGTTAEQLMDALARRAEPFGTSACRWLGQLHPAP